MHGGIASFGLVVIGTSHAGVQAAAAARAAGFEGTIALVGEEPDLPYHRPVLSKALLLGDVDDGKLLLRPPAFYAQQDLALLCGTRAVRIHAQERHVELDDGRLLAYGQLVLATGASCRTLMCEGAGDPGVLSLRSQTNARALRERLAVKRRLVIVGGGFIGLEVAAAARRLGVEVDLVEAGPRLLGRACGEPTARWLERLHRHNGVRFHLGRQVARVCRDGDHVAGVELDQGEPIPAELVVAGIGVQPRTALAADAGLEVTAAGILVDAGCRTSGNGIYAIGDCAATRHPWSRIDAPVRVESVQNALETARVAGANIAGRDERVAGVPWFWSDQYDARLQIAGLWHGVDRQVVRGDPDSGSFSVFYLDGEGVVRAADSIGAPKDHLHARRTIAAGGRLDDF